MSWDVDEKEFYETFAEIESDRGIEDAKRWAWSALDWTQKELRKKEDGVKEERAAVVAWMLARADRVWHGDGERALVVEARNIERGEHRLKGDE